MTQYIRKGELSVALRAHNPQLDEKANRALYGSLSAKFGAGFNGSLEVAWERTESFLPEMASQSFDAVLKKLDHRHLGLEEVGISVSTPESLLIWIAEELGRSNCKPKEVRLQRGESILYRASF